MGENTADTSTGQRTAKQILEDFFTGFGSTTKESLTPDAKLSDLLDSFGYHELGLELEGAYPNHENRIYEILGIDQGTPGAARRCTIKTYGALVEFVEGFDKKEKAEEVKEGYQ